MLRSNMPGSGCDDGRASLEFLVLGIAGVIPVMFLGLNIASIQGATLAAETATAHATRVFIQESTVDEALSRAKVAAVIALANHGISSYQEFSLSCAPSSCLQPGSIVTIRVGVDAPLFSTDLLPGVLGAETLRVTAESTRMVSRYGVPE